MERQTIGRYEIKGVLGRGHSGTVYDAWDPATERRVAVKAMELPDLSIDEEREQLERFRREARVCGRLSHPNIIVIHDYGETDELAYIVMEYIDGSDPVTFLKRRDLPASASAEAVRIIQDVLAALRFSHEQGVVHRDVKPSNVMVTSAGQVKIGDFGVARTEGSKLTQVGMQIGTPAYMSPEQLMGETADARSDIYSVGVMLYQLLAGEKPFEGSLTSIIHKVLHTRPPRPSALSLNAPPELDSVVEMAMAKRPEDRFGSAAEFSDALRAAVAAQTNRKPVSAPPEVDPGATIVRRVVPAGGGTDGVPAASPKLSTRATAAVGGILLFVAAAVGLAYVATNRSSLSTQPTQVAIAPAASPSTPAVSPGPGSAVSPATSKPAVSSQPRPAAEPTFGPPRDGKTLAEAIGALLPPEKQASRHEPIERYERSAILHRSLAITADGLTWWMGPFGSSREATNEVLEGCEIYHGQPCATAALDGAVLQDTPVIRAMPRVAYSGSFDPQQIPAVRPPRLLEADIAGYRVASRFKAVALHPWGRVFIATEKSAQQAADDAALNACAEDPERHGRDGPCYLYAEGNTVVLPRRMVGPPRSPVEALGADVLFEQVSTTLPQTNQSARSEARKFLGSGLNRALAYNPQTGVTFWWSQLSTVAEVRSGVMEGCQISSGLPCRLVTLNNDVLRDNEPVVSQSRVTYDGPFDPEQIPAITLLERSSADVAEYAAAPGAKAMAINLIGQAYTVVGRTTQSVADDAALDKCSHVRKAGWTCYLYASGDRVVLAERHTRPTGGEASLAR